MITAIVLWLGLQLPLGIVVGKFLKVRSHQACASGPKGRDFGEDRLNERHAVGAGPLQQIHDGTGLLVG